MMPTISLYSTTNGRYRFRLPVNPDSNSSCRVVLAHAVWFLNLRDKEHRMKRSLIFTTIAVVLLGGLFYWHHNYHPLPKRHLDAEARAMVQVRVIDDQYSVKNMSNATLDGFFVTCDD